MKILFVQTDSLNNVINSAMHIYSFEPLGLYYLAATIRDEHDVDLLDLNCETAQYPLLAEQLFLNKILTFQPDVICFSAFTSVRTGRILEFASTVKRLTGDVSIIVGGVHAALIPSDFDHQDIDFVISKNSIEIFQKVIACLNNGIQKQTIQRMIETSIPTSNSLLCKWPMPYRKLGMKYWNSYRISIGKPGITRIRERISSIKTSSGCPFRCNFCCLWQLYPKYQTRSVETVISELREIENELVFFADDESLIDINYMMSLADAIEKEGIRKRYVMYARSDTIDKNPSLLEAWAKAGLTQLWIGLEGSTDAQLKRYNKNNDTRSHESAIKKARLLGIDIHATALVDDSFQEKDFQHLLKYTRDYLCLTSCHFFVRTPFRGTSYYREIMSSEPSTILTQNPDHYSIRQSVIQPKHMSIEKFHQLFADLQRDFNSDTIPFSYAGAFDHQTLEEEFVFLKAKNETFYKYLLFSHTDYDDGYLMETIPPIQEIMMH